MSPIFGLFEENRDEGLQILGVPVDVDVGGEGLCGDHWSEWFGEE